MNAFEKEVRNVAETCTATRLRALNRLVSGIYDELLRPLDLKVSQLNILVFIAKLGTVRPGELCDLLCLDASTLSRNVDRMRARGWLELVDDLEDGRAHSVQVSAKGKDLLVNALPLWKRAQEKVERQFGERGMEAIRQASRIAQS